MKEFKTPHSYWNELMIFFTSLQLLELNHSLFNMLKPLFTNCILHLLEYIKTCVIQHSEIIFE
jgi:hypothetical protein